jgi:hypothetical protein
MIDPLGESPASTGTGQLVRAFGLDVSQRTHRWLPRRTELPTSKWSS